MSNKVTPIRKPEIRLEDLDSYHCPACGRVIFEQAVRMFRLSKLVTGKTQDEILNVTIWRCVTCGHNSYPQQLVTMTQAQRIELEEKIKESIKPQEQDTDDGSSI